MSAKNRHLKGKTNSVIVDVRAKTVIEAGDLLYALTGDSYYAYPFSTCVDTTGATQRAATLYATFLGVAMESSPSGVTEKITVAKSGVFRFPLVQNSAVTVGAKVSAVSSEAATSGASKDYVAIGTAGTADPRSSTCYLGYIVKSNTSAVSYVDFELKAQGGANAQISDS